MLDVMRRHAQSWMIKGLFAIIIIVFILFWGDFWEQGTPLQVVAIINGSKITDSEYQRSYENLANIYRNIFREGLSEETIKTMKLREKALDNLIESRLLLEEADRSGLRVSNNELIDSISKYPAFQKDNAFDKAQYMAVLRANRLTPEEFEEGQRKNLLVGKAEGIIKEGNAVSDEEVWEEYAKQKERVSLSIISMEPKSFLKDVRVSEDEAKDYFSKNKEAFKLPVAVKAEFITVSAQDMGKEITPKEDELRRYYEKNIDLFMHPERDKGARPFEEAKGQVAAFYNRERIEDILRERVYKAREEALRAKSMEEIAVKEKLRITKTGFFSAGEPVEGIGANPDFYKAAFSMKAGEVSQPVKTPFGYAIFKVVEKRESRIPEYGDAKEKVYKAVSEKKAKEMAMKKAEELLKGLGEGRLNISKLPYKPMETGLFTRSNSIPKVGASEDMNRAAFSLTKEMPYPEKPFSINETIYIIKLKERVEANREGFEEEKVLLKERLRQQRGENALKSWLKMARARAEIKIYEELLQ